MFECRVRIIPLMGRSVCEVVTNYGTHTAIAPTHRESFKAGMVMARVAMNQALRDHGDPNPVDDTPPDELEKAIMANMNKEPEPVKFDDMMNRIFGSSIVETECQCPVCRVKRGEAPNGPRHH